MRLIYIICIIIVISCNKQNNELVVSSEGIQTVINRNNANDPEYNLIFEKLVKIENENIDNPTSIVYYQEHIFVFDNTKNKLLKFDLEGKLLNQFGRIGKGPEEYLPGPQFCINNDTIIFISEDMRTIKFDLNGKYLNTNRVKHVPLKISYIKNMDVYIGYEVDVKSDIDGKFIVTYSLNTYDNCMNSIANLYEIGMTVTNIRQFDIYDGVYPFTVANDQIFVGTKSFNDLIISSYDYLGNMAYKFTNKFKQVRYSETELKALNDYYSMTSNGIKYDIEKTKKYSVQAMLKGYDDNIWVVVPTDVDKNKIDIYENGMFVNSIKYPDYLPGILIDQRLFNFEDYIFTIGESDISVYKYSIVR